MFRTILVHNQEQLLQAVHHLVYAGICRYHTSGCCVAVATQMPAYKFAPEDGLIQSETCRASNRKQSLITIILCILLVHLHTIKLIAQIMEA